MSGIVGFAGANLKQTRTALVMRMADAIQHLETDLLDKWTDGYFDVGRVHHGVVNSHPQPIFNEDGSLMVVMEGEIYNCRDLKRELGLKGHRFHHDHNHAEVCLHLYEEMGERAFRELNGSFLIIIYDLVHKKLIIANDRFASRPLYYCVSNELLFFATQVSPVIQAEEVPKTLDRRAVLEFFTFRRILGTRTYYRDIRAMPPANVFVFQKGRYALRKYWEMNFREGQRKPETYYVDTLTDAFRHAVRRRTSDDYDYGILLSGGLDSRMVLAAVPSGCSITGFTMGDWENREFRIARAVAKAKGIKHFFLQRWPDYSADFAGKISELSEGMYQFDTGTPIGAIHEIRKRGVDILLHGYGLDFKFQGMYLPQIKLNVLNRKGCIPVLASISNRNAALAKDILRKLRYGTDKEVIERLINDQFLRSSGPPVESIPTILREASRHARNPYNKWDYFVSGSCSRHYTYIFALEMAHYIDERTIMFDNDLLDAYLEIPPDLRFNAKIYRKVLQRLEPKLAAIPSANTGLRPHTSPLIGFGANVGEMALRRAGLKRKVPDPTFTSGSWPNIPELMRRNAKLRKLIWDTISDDQSTDPAIFNKPFLKEVFHRHVNGEKDYSTYFLLVLSFGMWYKQSGLNCVNA
jgi:asparagine synthase (glutamine-hydrolysing)